MTIQEQIAADQQAVAAAQADLDAANAILAADQAKLASIQPHLDLLDQIDAKLTAVEEGVDDTLRAALDSVKASITPLVAQMRALFSA